MCNCYQDKIDELEKRLPGILKEKDSGFKELLSIRSTNLIFALEGPQIPFFIDLEAKYDRENKKGKVTTKKMPIRLTPIHCPFCGNKYDTE